MGLSTNAIVCFGIPLKDNEGDYPWDRIDVSSECWAEANLPADVELVSHCSYEYPMYFLAYKGTEQTAFRGYPVQLAKATEYDGEKLVRIAAEHGLVTDGKAGWWAASMMG